MIGGQEEFKSWLSKEKKMKVMSSIVNCFKLYFGKSEDITEHIEEGVNVNWGARISWTIRFIPHLIG